MLESSAQKRIQEQMDRMRPSFTLMYCSEDPKEAPASFKYENRPVTLPPMQRIKVGDMLGLPVEQAYDYSLGPSQPRPWHGKSPKPSVTVAAAEKVIAHGLGLLWRQGVVMLTGNEASDAKEIEGGKGYWRTWRQAQDETVVGAFHKRMEDFVSDPRNKHLSRPLMGKLERESQSRLDRFRLEDAGVKVDEGLRCPASDCAYWSADPEELKRHALASHGADTPDQITADPAVFEKAQEEREQRRKTKRELDLAAKKAQLEAEMKEEPPAILAALTGPQEGV